MAEEKLISTSECAARKGVTRQTIHAAIQRGDIAAVKVGNSFVIKESDCEAYQPAFDMRDRINKRWGKDAGREEKE